MRDLAPPMPYLNQIVVQARKPIISAPMRTAEPTAEKRRLRFISEDMQASRESRKRFLRRLGDPAEAHDPESQAGHKPHRKRPPLPSHVLLDHRLRRVRGVAVTHNTPGS